MTHTVSDRPNRKNRVGMWIPMALLGLVVVYAGGCIRFSNGTYWVGEAPLAEGWPELTPIGTIEVKDYPDTRTAIVTADPQESADDDMGSMFNSLFNHIKSNDIAMTTPVQMGYEDPPKSLEASRTATPQMMSMAFLYRRSDQGKLGIEGRVSIEDLPGRTYASLGVRGNYKNKRFAENLTSLDAWLRENANTWQADGPPRYLGYNSPFVPWFMKYGEVQRPVRPASQ